jgi:hypothetical protein
MVSILVVSALAGVALTAQRAPVAPAGAAEATSLPPYQGPVPEHFLAKARVVRVQDIPKGVASPRRVTLVLDGVEHQAVFKSIDVYRQGFSQFDAGGGEGDFQDTWMTELAAYQVDRVMAFGRVPATVERFVRNEKGSLQWWVESQFAEADREKRAIDPPDHELWNRENLRMLLFDNLIYNTDRNANNILIANDWTLRLIDHSRSFRPFSALKTPKQLTRFSRSMLDGMKKLERNDLKKRVGKYLSGYQLRALLVRRDLILKLAAETVAEKGEAAALFP